ncbi:hypothetical protein [Flavobacterium silvaticum]|uniref:Lipoprotein n=1 Tax=Flavobacterium silvaticum TaxID=1852020 RepID=A0A972JFF7_9FLAO|nr:hypothetical protein [Flavobacterium silvaticum]NMH27914.1 hypothetical protein [Flavobacterium silvaticum]
MIQITKNKILYSVVSCLFLLISCSEDDNVKNPIAININGTQKIFSAEVFSPHMNQYGIFDTAIVARNPDNSNELVQFSAPLGQEGENIITEFLYKQNELTCYAGQDFQTNVEMHNNLKFKGSLEGIIVIDGSQKHIEIRFDVDME